MRFVSLVLVALVGLVCAAESQAHSFGHVAGRFHGQRFHYQRPVVLVASPVASYCAPVSFAYQQPAVAVQAAPVVVQAAPVLVQAAPVVSAVYSQPLLLAAPSYGSCGTVGLGGYGVSASYGGFGYGGFGFNNRFFGGRFFGFRR